METANTDIPLNKRNLTALVWQHLFLIISLYIMTLGVALCVRSELGSSVISTIPFIMTLVGEEGYISKLTIGEWTYIMNFALVGLQILVLRRNFEVVQLFQLVIGFIFGWLLDVNMALTSILKIESIVEQIICQVLGCLILGFGIAFEIKCGSVTMPGEGLPAALSKQFGRPFAGMKIIIDILLVTIAVITGYCYFGKWEWKVVGTGTLFAMLFVGYVVKVVTPHIRWFDNLLCYRPDFRCYICGLARYLRDKSNQDNVS